MPGDAEFLQHVCDGFNARDMDAVLAALHP